MRERMTRKVAVKSLEAEIKELQDMITANDDSKLESEAQSLAKEEQKVVKSPVAESPKGQNDKAMKNWPVADKEKVAATLVKLAKLLLDD